VTDRLNIIDDLLAGMEKKLQWLEVGMQKTTLFFKERESQEHEFATRVRHSLPQLGDHFESINQPNTLYEFSRGMKESDNFHAMETRNSEIMAMFIKKDILDWILLPSEKAYRSQSGSLRVPLYNYRRRLDWLSRKRARAYKKYFKIYDKIQKNPTQSSYEDKIFKRQMKYSLAAREELRYLKMYSEQGIIVINEFTTLATTRISEIQRAFSMYLQKYTELNQNTVTPPQPILELIENTNQLETMRQMFLPISLMNVTNYDFLRNRLQRPDITFTDLENYLVHFPESVDPARSSFVIKEWNAVREGNIFRRPRACTIIATNVNNLILVEKRNEDHELAKVKNPMQLRYTRVEGIEPGHEGYGTTVNIVERTPGTLFNHTHRNKIRFETQEEAGSFLAFVNNQTAQLNGEVTPITPLMTQQGIVSGTTFPVGGDFGLQGTPIVSNVGQVAPITYQTGLINSQINSIPAVNAQSIVTRQYIPPTQTVDQFATPVRGQQMFLNGQYSPISQNSVMSSAPGQVIYQTVQAPVNQVAQISGDL